MNYEEKIRYHCQLVVEYKDVDAIYSKKNIEIVTKLFFEILHSSSKIPFSLFSDVVQTILKHGTQQFELTKEQQLLIQAPNSNHEFNNLFQVMLDSYPESISLIVLIILWFKKSTEFFRTEDSKRLFFDCLEKALNGHNKVLAIECCLVLLKFFSNDSDITEELHLTVIALLAAMGVNELVRAYHQKTILSQSQESGKLRQYNVLLSYNNDRNSEAIEKLWSELTIESFPKQLRKNIERLYALNLARMKRNNDAKEILEQLADEYINEKNTKEYLKIHCDIVSIIPNDNVEKFATYLLTIEQLFEQSNSKEYLLTLYAKKHEYAKLHNKYEAIALAKSFLLASSIQSYEFLEEVSYQLSELAKKRKKNDQALEFLTVSTNAKTAVFENRLVSEQQKNTAEKLIIEYFGII